MRKLLFYLIFLIVPAVNNAGVAVKDKEKEDTDMLYAAVRVSECGLGRDVFELALKGLRKLEANGKLKNPGIVTIADYSQSSTRKRLYVIDLKNRKILFNTYVAHGRNTGDEFARSFSNTTGSLKSSLGFYITEQPVVGPHTGFSLILDGVEKGFNDNASRREIIIHAADYATENFIKKTGRLGRSYGCPALPPDLNRPIIETIKGGSCLFIYNPDSCYLCSSTLLK
jgi:hypothetical protein